MTTPNMTLAPFHPFSLDYTADPKPSFAEFHRDNRLVFVPELKAVAVHGYDAVRAFCDHPQMSRNPADAGLVDPAQDDYRMARWPTLEAQMRRTVAGDQQGLARMRELLAPDFKPAMIRKMAATVKDVVARLAINPNTVLKAYRELEREGLVAARPGVGTFVTRSLADDSLAAHEPLRRDLRRWLAKARLAGLDEESIEALFASTFRHAQREIA